MMLDSHHTLSLTTIIVNLKIQKNSNKNPILFLGLQNSLQYAGKFSDSLNLLSRTSSRACKWVHSRKRPQTHYIVRHSSGSIFVSSALRNPFPKALSLFSSEESGKKSVGSNPKMLTTPRVITSKLSSKRLSFLKLPTAFPTLIPKEKVFTMSWNDQVSAEEDRDLIFRLEIASQIIQRS